MDTFLALSDPTRRSIVKILAVNGRLSASDIGKRFRISPPAISQHLKVLRDARLVRMEKKAQQRIYAMDPSGLTEMEQWMEEMKKLWNDRLDALETFLEEEMNRTATPAQRRKPNGKRK